MAPSMAHVLYYAAAISASLAGSAYWPQAWGFPPEFRSAKTSQQTRSQFILKTIEFSQNWKSFMFQHFQGFSELIFDM